ncbi:MAG: hypothetical protein ACPGTO_09345 [Polaribacter sp.]
MKQRVYIDTSVVGGYFDKEFDAVKMMREIRNKISEETQGMKLAELKAYIKAKLTESKMKPIGQ